MIAWSSACEPAWELAWNLAARCFLVAIRPVQTLRRRFLQLNVDCSDLYYVHFKLYRIDHTNTVKNRVGGARLELQSRLLGEIAIQPDRSCRSA